MAKDFDFLSGMDFGTGVNTLHVNVRGNAVQSKTGSPPKSTDTGQVTSFALLRTESVEDYQSALSVNVDAAGMFGLFGGSNSFNFGQQRNFHSFSQFLVVAIRVQNPLFQIPDPALTPSAASLLVSGQVERFQQEFGDSFVLGISSGGLYHAVLEFTTRSQQELDDLSDKLDASEFGVFAAEAAFSSKISKFIGESRLEINSFQIGGAGEGAKQEVNVDAIITKAQNFPAQVQKNARNMFAVVQDYQSLDLPGNPVDIEAARLVLTRYGKIRNQLAQTLDDIDYITLHRGQFIAPDIGSLAKAQADVQDALDKLKASASACATDVKNCTFTVPTLPSVDLPARRPIDITSFNGRWRISASSPVTGIDVPGKNLNELLITPEDSTHANVTGLFADNHGPVTATAEWDQSTKALQVALRVKEAASDGVHESPAVFHALQIRLVPQTPPTLAVIDDYGFLISSTENRLDFSFLAS